MKMEERGQVHLHNTRQLPVTGPKEHRKESAGKSTGIFSAAPPRPAPLIPLRAEPLAEPLPHLWPGGLLPLAWLGAEAESRQLPLPWKMSS